MDNCADSSLRWCVSSTLCRYDIRMGLLLVLNWARVRRVSPGRESSEGETPGACWCISLPWLRRMRCVCTMLVCICAESTEIRCRVTVSGCVSTLVVQPMLLNVVCPLSLGVCGWTVSLCSGCVGCCAFRLTCDACSCKCWRTGSTFVSSCRCCVLVSCVHPVAILRAVKTSLISYE